MGRWIELDGRAEPLRALRAPLSDAPCVLYRVELSRWQRFLEGFDGRGGAARELAGARFVLRRDGDAAPLIVDPSRAVVRLRGGATLRRRIRVGEDAELDARIIALYARLGRGRPPRATVICRERRLAEGAPVRVAGELLVVPAAAGALEGGYREPPRAALLRAATLWC